MQNFTRSKIHPQGHLIGFISFFFLPLSFFLLLLFYIIFSKRMTCFCGTITKMPDTKLAFNKCKVLLFMLSTNTYKVIGTGNKNTVQKQPCSWTLELVEKTWTVQSKGISSVRRYNKEASQGGQGKLSWRGGSRAESWRMSKQR